MQERRIRGFWTVPNVLTVMRMALIPFFVRDALDGNFERALTFFVIAGFSDALDGFLARALDQRSTWGRILDPIADKLLLGCAFVCATITGLVPLWLTCLALARDAVILSGSLALHLTGVEMRSRVSPLFLGKFNTLMQLSYVFLILQEAAGGGLVLGAQGRSWLEAVVAGMALISGVGYVREGFSIRRQAQA